MTFELLRENPRLHLLFMLDEPEAKKFMTFRREICNLIGKIQVHLMIQTGSEFKFRGIEFNKLDIILENGIDVYPTNSVIYLSDDPCKSMEYGWDYTNHKMILLLYDSDSIERTYVQIPANTPESEIVELMQTYPTKEYLDNGTIIWLSKLALEDNRRTTSYEFAYGGWIPNNQLKALRGIICIGVFTEYELNKLRLKLTTVNHE